MVQIILIKAMFMKITNMKAIVDQPMMLLMV